MGIACSYNNVGFIESESELGKIDPDIRGVARNINKICHAVTHGVSCSGHFEQDDDKIDAIPYGSLSLVLCIKIPYINELVKRLFDFKDEHEGTSICAVTDKYIHHYFAKELHDISDINEKHIIGRTNEDYDIINLVIKQMDLGSMGPDFSPSIMQKIDISFPYYNKAKRRYEEIKKNWAILECKLDDYCLEYGFNDIDFEKKEFAPFR